VFSYQSDATTHDSERQFRFRQPKVENAPSSLEGRRMQATNFPPQAGGEAEGKEERSGPIRPHRVDGLFMYQDCLKIFKT
jgi:hypothetical protein